MSESLDWNELANTTLDEVERPKAIPIGHYVGVISGAGVPGKRGQNQTSIIDFPVRLTEPTSDVDQEAFEASSGFRSSGYKVTFWMTPAALYRYTEFAKGMGAPGGISIPEAAEYLATCGEPFVVSVTNREDGKGGVFVDLDDPVPLSVFQEREAA